MFFLLPNSWFYLFFAQNWQATIIAIDNHLQMRMSESSIALHEAKHDNAIILNEPCIQNKRNVDTTTSNSNNNKYLQIIEICSNPLLALHSHYCSYHVHHCSHIRNLHSPTQKMLNSTLVHHKTPRKSPSPNTCKR